MTHFIFKVTGLEADGLCTIYDRSFFELENAISLKLDDGLSKYRFNRVAQLLHFSTRVGRRKHHILCVNPHLHWDPKYEKVKFEEIAYIEAEIRKLYEKISKKTDYISILILGDFNSTPSSDIMKHLLENSKSRFSYESAYSNFPDPDFE